MQLFCSKCGTPVEAGDKFCKSCGEIVGAPTSKESIISPEPNSGFDPLLNQPRKKRRKALWITAAAVVVVIGGGGTALASTMDAFASGKTLMLDAIANQPVTSDSQASWVQTWHIKLTDLSAPNLPAAPAALLATLNNAAIDLNIQFSPKDKKAELDFNTQYQSVTHQGKVWVSSDSAVVSAADYQSLLAPVLGQGIKIPQYLVSDSSQAKAITDFWTQLSQNRQKLTKDQWKAVQNVEKLMVTAIPDQYIHRKGLTGVELQFDQNGLSDILTAQVKNVYSHKQEFADAVSQLASLSSNLPAGTNASTIQQNLLNGLNQTPEEAVLAGISTVLNAGVISTDPMTISLTKSLFGSHVTEDISGGIAVKDPQNNLTAKLAFTVHATSPGQETIQMPSVNHSNSQTFTDFANQAGPSATTN
jgi:hypothetical protein